MTAFPAILAGRRRQGVALVALAALAQAGAAASAAVATQRIFFGFYQNAADMPWAELATLAAAGLALALGRVAARTAAERLGYDFAGELRIRLFRHLSAPSARQVSALGQGVLSVRFVGDLKAIRNWISLGLARLITAAIVLPSLAALLTFLSPALALAALPVLGASVVALLILGRRLEPLHRQARGEAFGLAAELMERDPAAPGLRALGVPKDRMDMIADRSERLVDAAVRRAEAASVLRVVPDAAFGIAAALMVGTAVHHGLASFDLAFALAVLALMLHPLRDLAGVADRHRAWSIARQRCLAVLRDPTPAATDDRPGKSWSRSAGLEFAAVAAGPLRGFTAAAAPGEKIAVVGPPGAGKSTLLALAGGTDTPGSGRVWIDGVAPETVPVGEIVHVSARSPILRGSLRRALTLGLPGHHEDDGILDAARRAGLASLVQRIGLDGRVGQDAETLSRGDRARLLMARCALARPRLLLVDDLDQLADAGVRLILVDFFGSLEATALFVSADPGAVQRADRVWVLDNGRLAGADQPQQTDRHDRRPGAGSAYSRTSSAA